jgi:hypothetical protein
MDAAKRARDAAADKPEAVHTRWLAIPDPLVAHLNQQPG